MTGELVNKFWVRMAEKIGRRWYEQYGTTARPEWTALINQYTEQQINVALENLPKWEHPPTHPAMAAYLRSFVAKRGERSPEEWMRDFWRSTIIAELKHWGAQRGYWQRGFSFADVRGSDRDRLLSAISRIVERAVAAETQLGHRPDGLMKKVSKECERTIATLREPIVDPTVERYA